MKANDIRSKLKKKFRIATTHSKHSLPVSPNHLQCHFTAERPNQVWLSYITYLKINGQWLYLAVNMNMFSRQIISWELSKNLSTDFVLRSLKKAVAQRRPKEGLIFHSDRGIQYASLEMRSFLQEHGFKQSMSRKGDCYDNAVMESFFKTFKAEFFNYASFAKEHDMRLKIFDYINIFYNHKRLHSTLG